MGHNRDDDRSTTTNSRQTRTDDSTLLPMLFGGLALVVIGAGVVMTMV